MSEINRAVSCFNEGFSCSQAIFSAFSEKLGVPRDLAFKIASGFGGGMSRMGETCGAVTGAFMVIGLKYSSTSAKNVEAKEKTYTLVRDFAERFKKLYGSLKCKELIHCDLITPEDRELAKKKNIFNDLCQKFVRSAAEILKEIL